MKTMMAITALLMGLALPARADHKHVTVHVKGMVCAFCSQGLTKKFETQPGVSKIDVNLDKKVVKLSLTHDASGLSDSQITEMITGAGFNVDKIVRD